MDPAPEPDTAAIIWKLLLLLFLVLVNAFFAMSEIAVISLNDNKIKAMAEDGHKGARRIMNLTANASGFLSTIQIGVTLAGFLTSASASDSFSEPLADLIYSAEWTHIFSKSAWEGISLVLVTIIMSYFSLVLGELVPKRIAMQNPEKVSFTVAPVLLFFKKILRPFVAFLSVSTNCVVRLLGYDPNADQENVTEEEILMMVDAGEEKGVIEESQKEMINNIFEFDDIVAADVMTHRTEIEGIELHTPIQDIIKLAIDEGYSRIPVYDDELDNICGILYVKDLLKYIGNDIPKSFKLTSVLRKPVFVPESKKCGDLFNEMTARKIQMVIVVDEYGGVAGLVTVEDLLESIVGNIQDEYDDEIADIKEESDGKFTLDGTSDLKELSETLDIEFPEGEYDTIGGFIMSELGRIPEADENPEIEFGGYRFKVVEMDERRISKVIAEKMPEDTGSDDGFDEKNRDKDRENDRDKDREREKEKDKNRSKDR